MTQCQGHRCEVDVPDAYLCNTHRHQLAATLREIPWWLDRLTETAVGQARLGNPGPRTQRDILHGDKTLAECVEPLPGCGHDDPDHDCDCNPRHARNARQRHALAAALAAGGCNARASELLAEIADSLAYWVRVLCETRGLPTPTLPAGRSLGAPLAVWLHRNIGDIAQSEDAGDIIGDVIRHRRDIERVVNRPITTHQLGTCQADIATADGQTTQCDKRLRAPADATIIRCPKCKTSHSVSRLLLAGMDEAERKPLTAKRLKAVNQRMPESWRVPKETLRRWIADGKLSPIGEVDGEPVYQWADLVTLRKSATQRNVLESRS